MARLVNRVAALLAVKGMEPKEFVAYCMLAGMGQDTAYRLVRGDTNFTVDTLATVADVLKVRSLSEIIDIMPE